MQPAHTTATEPAGNLAAFYLTHRIRQALARVPMLTPRELEVLHLLCGGLTNREIGRRLFVTERTVKAHVAAIVEKLELESRLQASLVACLHFVDVPSES